jgi:hypothetical protein
MKPYLLAVIVVTIVGAAGCRRRSPGVRTDPEPIVSRVQVPADTGDVVWIAEPVVSEGWIPAHDSPTRIHAFIAGYAGHGAERAAGRIEVPLVVANEILPASLRARGVVSGDSLRIEGTTPGKNELERPDKAQVRQALVTSEGLVMELWVR